MWDGRVVRGNLQCQTVANGVLFIFKTESKRLQPQPTSHSCDQICPQVKKSQRFTDGKKGKNTKQVMTFSK